MSEPIWSTGGTGGERAVTEDLEWAVGVLRVAADDVRAAQVELARRRAALELDSSSGLGASVGHAEAWAELTSVAYLRAPALEEQIHDIARRLRAVAQAYLDAERRAQHRVGILERLRQGVEDGGGTATWLARVAPVVELAAVPGGAPLIAGGLRTPVTRLLPEDRPPSTGVVDRSVAEALAASPSAAKWKVTLELALAALEHLMSEPWEGALTAHVVSTAPTGSVEDAMRRLRATELARGGAVRIERWTGDDGVTRRIVFVPGTQDWGFWSSNPSDVEADVSLALGQLPDAARVVDAALEADGAKPGEPVMLVGHSLGGIVATALAGSSDFRRKFTVEAVVTAGSPTGAIALPRTVRALHLEGTRDIVPGLDGRPNPDTHTRVTVHHDVRDSEIEALDGEGKTMGSAHSLDTYAQTARIVDEGLSASTDAWLDSEKNFFEPGHDVVTIEYRPDDRRAA